MNLLELYDYYMTQNADPRTNQWALVGSTWQVLLIVATYVYFIYGYGPRYMKDRPPYSLKSFMFYYNIFQIVVNAILVYACLTAGWTTEYTLGCEPCRYNLNDPLAHKMVHVAWWLLLLKWIDLVETGVFVLRKKQDQISFLHVYHHISTPTITWLIVKFSPGGMVTMIIIINCTVHVIMYTYYLFCSLGSIFRKIVAPIKPYITMIQLSQFCFLMLHQMQGFAQSCPIPKILPTVVCTNIIVNFALFYNFYQRAYVKGSKKIM